MQRYNPLFKCSLKYELYAMNAKYHLTLVDFEKIYSCYMFAECNILRYIFNKAVQNKLVV